MAELTYNFEKPVNTRTNFPPQSASTLELYWTGLSLLNGFSFLVNFFWGVVR